MAKLGLNLAAIATAATAGCLSLGIGAMATLAQSTSEIIQQIPPSVLAEIREGPFSRTFPLADGAAYAIKDKDYQPSQPEMGVFTLWADVPDRERLQMVMKYCVPNTAIARAAATLTAVTLMDGDTELVVIDAVIDATPSNLNEVQPERVSNVSTSFYYDPFYTPYYYSPFSFGLSYSPPVYVPAVDCSGGLARFDLLPVQDALAQLPNQTLRLRLLFSDGNTEYWNLGGGTVSALKELPTIRQ